MENNREASQTDCAENTADEMTPEGGGGRASHA